MRGLVPRIHALALRKDVDGRDKPGHDDREEENRGPSMTVYMVFDPPRADGDSLRHAERIRFVRDRFSWSAFLFAPLWMLRHRLWLAVVAYLVVVAGATTVLAYAGARASLIALALMLFNLLVGIEAATLRRRSLLRRGWRDRDIVIGDDREAAERRFFDRYVIAETTREMELALAASVRAPAPPPAPPPGAPDVLGLFPQPGVGAGAGPGTR
jgi:hypothetical protein